MKVVVSKIKFYGIFLWRKTNSPPEYIENLLSVSVDIAIRLNTWNGGIFDSCYAQYATKDR